MRTKFVSSHLSKELRAKYRRRSIPVRKGDSVKVMRGKFKGESGKVDVVDRKSLKVYLEGLKITKKDGTEVRVSVDPSNLLVTSMNLEDKKRIKEKKSEKPHKKEEKKKVSKNG